MKDLGYIKECPNCKHSVSYDNYEIKYVKRFENLVLTIRTNKGEQDIDCYDPEDVAKIINGHRSQIRHATLKYSYSLPYIICPNCGKTISIDKKPFYRNEFPQ
jgi:endogenous inhibitor of DNA gyrase (YacG/DUF329 family)